MMSRSICKSRLFTSNLGPLSKHGHTHLTNLPFLQSNSLSFFSKPFSSSISLTAGSVTQDDEQQRSFVVSYLVNSCGLSPQRADSAYRLYGNKLRFDSSEKPDSVLALFRNHGFSDADITGMVIADPRILFYSEKIILSKFQFFYSIGFTKEDLPSFLSSCKLWRSNSCAYMVPLCGLLKDVLKSDKEVVSALKRMGWLLQKSGYKSLEPNLTLLKEIGVPDSKIAFMLKHVPNDLLIYSDEFFRIVNDVKEIGFDVSKCLFVLAIHALTSSYKTTRDRCSQVYEEWGFSQKDIISLFRKWPQCLLLSEKKLRANLDFLVNTMGCQVEAISQFPQLLSFSLEKRIIPRCSVIHVLIQKGLFKKDGGLYFAMCHVENIFLNRYVYRYPDIASHLLLVYQRKLDPFKESSI